MSLFACQYILAWQDECWVMQTLQDFLVRPKSQSPLDTSFESAVQQLSDTLIERTSIRALILPDDWVITGTRDLENEFPAILYRTAAHTYSAEVSPLTASERMTGYCAPTGMSPTTLFYAVLSADDYRTIRHHIECPIYCEALIRQANSSNWSKVKAFVQPFLTFQKDYIEDAKAQKYRKNYLITVCLIPVLTLSTLIYIWLKLPSNSPILHVPHLNDHDEHSIVSSLNYLRSLPAQARLNEVDITNKVVQLSLNGRIEDIELWRKNWPDHLPPLKVSITSGGCSDCE